MSDTVNNPFLVLGVDFGSSTGAATAAFGRASKRVRREGSLIYSVEDLTAALNRIEEAHRNGEAETLGEYFRVPANPQAYEISAEEGLLLLPVTPQQRKTAPITPEAVEHLRQAVVTEAASALLTSRESPTSAYGLGVVLGGDLALDQPAPSMASQLKSAHRAAIADLGTRIPLSQDPEQLAGWARALTQTDEIVPAKPALALLMNPQTPKPVLSSLLESERLPLEVAQEAAESPNAGQALLAVLASHGSILVRERVAANPVTLDTILATLGKDQSQQVRKAARRGRSWPVWLKIGIGLLAILAVLFGIALATGYLKLEFNRLGSESGPSAAPLSAEPGSPGQSLYPATTPGEWRRIVRNPDNFVGDRLTFYAQVAGFDPQRRTEMLVDALPMPPVRYTRKSFVGDRAWVTVSRADRAKLSQFDEISIRAEVLGQTKVEMSNGDVFQIPEFRSSSIVVLEQG